MEDEERAHPVLVILPNSSGSKFDVKSAHIASPISSSAVTISTQNAQRDTRDVGAEISCVLVRHPHRLSGSMHQKAGLCRVQFTEQLVELFQQCWFDQRDKSGFEAAQDEGGRRCTHR